MGEVVITAGEWREYQGLLENRDNELYSLRTQLRLQNVNALKLAGQVVKLLDMIGIENATAMAGKLAADVYDLANEIIAEE